ncbi:MAG: hypothetical protein WCO26_00570 [Deltaproteobacteria bacterium]
MGTQQTLVEVMVAGKTVTLPQRLSGKDIREIGNLNGRVVMLQRGNHKEIVNDSDILALRDGDTFLDSPIYRVG